jgi:hypothetical protein
VTASTPGEGAVTEIEEQPYAKLFAHPPQPPKSLLLGQDLILPDLPLTRRAERALPHAREQVARGAYGEL